MKLSLTIQIVGWNSASHLPRTAAALQVIPKDKAAIRYIDNNSSDNSVNIVRAALPHASIVECTENKGFAPAHNIGFAACTTPFVMTHDPDVELNWEGVQELLNLFHDPKIAAVQGKLLRSAGEDGIIDSAGIVHTIALNGKERGANEKDRGQFDKPARLLAVTGACAIYRTKALRQVAHGKEKLEIFDNSFFAYKEDVDIGWRLNKAGWKVFYHPVLMGYHHRTLGKRGLMNWGLNPINVYGRLQSPRTYYSIRNYNWMIAKNATWKQLIIRGIFIDARNLTFFFLSIFYPPLLKVWPEIFRGLPKMIQRRGRNDNIDNLS